MKLFLVAEDQALLSHWNHALEPFNPIIMDGIEKLSMYDEGTVFTMAPLDITALQRYPHFHFMILSMTPDFDESQKYLKEGAMGYGNAMMHESHLVSAFKTLEERKVWLYPDFVTQLILQIKDQTEKQEKSLHLLDDLSVREKEVALLLGEGKSHLEISETLGITIRTIKAHSASIYEKLQVKDRLALSILLHS